MPMEGRRDMLTTLYPALCLVSTQVRPDPTFSQSVSPNLPTILSRPTPPPRMPSAHTARQVTLRPAYRIPTVANAD